MSSSLIDFRNICFIIIYRHEILVEIMISITKISFAMLANQSHSPLNIKSHILVSFPSHSKMFKTEILTQKVEFLLVRKHHKPNFLIKISV